MLSNFPLSARLRTLLLARNRISSIQPTLHKSIPHLTTLVLSSNRMQELADLDPLGGFRKLTHLVLMENPVCKKEVCQHRMTVAYGHWLTCSQHYRAWVLWRCPSVRFLDYKKVKQAERDEANELFGSVEAPTALASKVANPLNNAKEFLDKQLTQIKDSQHQISIRPFSRHPIKCRNEQDIAGEADRQGAEARRAAHQERKEPTRDCSAGEGAERGQDTRRHSRRCNGRELNAYHLSTVHEKTHEAWRSEAFA